MVSLDMFAVLKKIVTDITLNLVKLEISSLALKPRHIQSHLNHLSNAQFGI